MALLLNIDRVKYTCSCGKRFPLCKLFLCKYCREIRCKLCLSHEVDNYFCSQCLDNRTSGEVRSMKNMCTNCCECPSCGHALSTRLTAVHTPNPDDPTGAPLQRKMYYLACTLCRWSTRDAGIPDVTTSTGGYMNRQGENPLKEQETEQVNTVMKYYATLGMEELIELKTKSTTARRKSYVFKRDLFRRRRSSVVQNLAKQNMLNPSADILDKNQPIEKPNFPPTSEIDPLPESYWTQPLNLNAVTTIEQRISDPGFLPETRSDLFPVRKSLTTKRSLRCMEPQCDHNLIKPEYIPQSTKFKLHLVALLFVPEIRLARQPLLDIDSECEVILTVCNPTDNPVKFRLQPLDPHDPDLDPTSDTNCKLIVPPLLTSGAGLEIGGTITAMEFADTISEDSQYKDDPEVVVQRSANKVHIRTKVTPTEIGEEIICGVRLHYELMSDAPLSNKDNQEQVTYQLSTLVYLDLGFAR